MIRYIIEKEAEKDFYKKPYERTITPLAAPWTLGTTQFWLATDEIVPNNASDPHCHEDQEEAFFFLSGRGRVRIDDEEMEVEPGYCVFSPMGTVHSIINDGSEILRFIAVVAPPFKEPVKKSK